MQIIAVGAPHHVLVEEAGMTKLLMRLAESKGAMEFHPDLLQYYAYNHGGLNEYKNLVWKRRDGTDLMSHFKADEDLSDEELALRQARYNQVFTSALAQRLVLSRLQRKAKYSPMDQMSLAKKGNKGASRMTPDARVIMHVKHRTGMIGKHGSKAAVAAAKASRHKSSDFGKLPV